MEEFRTIHALSESELEELEIRFNIPLEGAVPNLRNHSFNDIFGFIGYEAHMLIRCHDWLSEHSGWENFTGPEWLLLNHAIHDLPKC